MNIGDRIRKLMEERGISQVDLAQATGLDRSDLNRLINNKRPPRTREVQILAQAFNIRRLDLVAGFALPDDVEQGLAQIVELEATVLGEKQRAERLRAQLTALEVAVAAERAECRQAKLEMAEDLLAADAERHRQLAEVVQLQASVVALEEQNAALQKQVTAGARSTAAQVIEWLATGAATKRDPRSRLLAEVLDTLERLACDDVSPREVLQDALRDGGAAPLQVCVCQAALKGQIDVLRRAVGIRPGDTTATPDEIDAELVDQVEKALA